MSEGPYRNGRVHVMAKMCETCIFRPGNLMNLDDGRVEQMVAGSIRANSCIICHDTLNGSQAVCHGSFKLHPTQTLQLAERMNMVEFVSK